MACSPGPSGPDPAQHHAATGAPSGAHRDTGEPNEMTTVPFTDLAAMTKEIWPAIERDYLACLLGAGYIGGPAVESFEREWAAYCGTDHAVGVANGTDALQLSLTALGIGPGDE